MAVYKIFPTQDATLYSYYPLMNTGLDAICEISNQLNILVAGETPIVARFLTQFSSTEINDTITNKISSSQYNIFFRNYISEAQGVNLNVNVELDPLAQSWNNGTGHFLDSPVVDNGCSWKYSNFSGSGEWSLSGSIGGYGYTGSWSGSNENGEDAIGGGSWFTGSTVTQSFALRTSKDIEVDVSDIVRLWYSESISNNGFIVRLTGSSEFNKSKYLQPSLKYYSVDTNTIYPPQLEFRWRDYTSSMDPSASIISNSDIKLSLSENPSEFNQDAVNKFYVNVSPLYPERVFQTSSLYTNPYYLPTSSYYAVKDLDTNEFVISFDDQYTQISADSKGNYFTIYMNGLEPERYYSVLIKTIISGSTLIIDDENYFKVING